MNIRYDSLSERYKAPFGALQPGQPCRLTVEAPEARAVLELEAVVAAADGGPGFRVPLARSGGTDGFHAYSGTFSLPDCGLYHYHFVLQTPDGQTSLFRDQDGGLIAGKGKPWQITCCPKDFTVPKAFQGAVVYQIFPDRFARAGECSLSGKLEPYWLHDRWEDTPQYRPNEDGEVLNNDFFGGNFNGIRDKLGYLDGLGVEVLYLNPICMAWSNHRYDTADYLRPDPMLGTEEDFAALCREAHALGMKVILDGVFSHTGSNSVYFDQKGTFGGGAASDPGSPYRSWYDFQRWPDQYTAWWDFKTLPCVNELDPAYLDFIIKGEHSVIAYWLSLGADGFRLDVADELPDEFISAFRARLKELKPDALLMGEVWEDASNKISYGVRRTYFSAGELDSVMNYPFHTAILDFMSDGDASAFRAAVMAIVENYPEQVLHCVMNSLSTHDTPRILTLLGDTFEGIQEEKAERFLSPDALALAVKKEMAAAVLQFTLPGMACVYYGDEAGLEGFGDPFNRRCFPWGREVTELQEFYRALARLKRSLPGLRRGRICFQKLESHVVCYTRQLNGQRVWVAVNGGEAPAAIPLRGRAVLLRQSVLRETDVLLKPWGTAILIEEVKP